MKSPVAPKSRSSDMARQRQRDAAALDAFTKYVATWCVGIPPTIETWQEMMLWIRKNFTPTRPA